MNAVRLASVAFVAVASACTAPASIREACLSHVTAEGDGAAIAPLKRVSLDPANLRLAPSPPARARIQHLATYAGDCEPYGLAFQGETLWVCDLRGQRLLALDLAKGSGKVFQPEGVGRLVRPVDVGCEGDRLYVLDAEQKRVVTFDATGDPISSLSVPEDAIGLAGVAVSSERILVSEPSRKRVWIYDKDTGELERLIEGRELGWIGGAAASPQGDFVLADAVGSKVRLLTQAGTLGATFGSGVGDATDGFFRPKGVACDRQGRVYVVDSNLDRMQIFGADGTLLAVFGERRGDAGDLRMPARVALGYDQVALFQDVVQTGYELELLIAVTNQEGPAKVQIYGLLRPAGGDGR